MLQSLMSDMHIHVLELSLTIGEAITIAHKLFIRTKKCLESLFRCINT
jgi:hypothetical protein